MASESQRLTDAMAGAAAGAVAVGATAYAIDAWRRSSERTVLDGKPTTLERVDSRSVTTDPNTFQFKSGGDSHGVTDRLQGVKKWNAAAAGKVMLFERADGTRVVADGHQRTGLAQRLVAGGHEPIKLDAIVLRERDGWQPRDVRAYAAIKNMHESSGNALDMAKVMRERPDLVTSSLPVTDAKIREAKALAALSEPAFKMVVGGAIKPEHAAAVGEAVKEPSRHVDLLTEMQKAKVSSTQHARLYVNQALAAPTISETSASLFGEEKSTRSLLKERAAVLDKALSALKSDKRIFGLLERESANIEAVGNKLSHEANASKAEGAGKLAELVEKLSTTRGRVSDMIDRAAMQIANGETPAKAARALVKSVGDVMKEGGMKALTGDEPRRMVEMADAPKDAYSRKSKTGLPRMEPQSSFLPGSRLPWDAQAEAAKISNMSDRELSQVENANKARVTPNMTERHKLATAEIAKRKANPGWSDAARAASAEVRATDAKGQTSLLPEASTKDKIAAASRAKAAKGRTGDPADHGLFGSSAKQTDLVEMAKTAPPAKPSTAGQKAKDIKNIAAEAIEMQNKWLAERGIKSLDEVRAMTQPERNKIASEWEKYYKSSGADRSSSGGEAPKAKAPSPSEVVKEAYRLGGAETNPKASPVSYQEAEASMKAQDTPERAAERQRIADGTKRIGDTYKAPPATEPSKSDSFAKGLTPMASAKAKAALDMQVRHNGKEFLTRAALVERQVADGAVVKTMKIAGKEERVLMGKDGAFLDARNITKAGLDYAEHLSKGKNPGWSDAAREGSAKERGVALPGEAKPKKPSPGKVKAAVQAVAGKPAPTGADLAKKLAANEKRSASMKARAALKSLEKAAVAKAQSDDRYSNTGRAAADAKAIAEAKTKVSVRKPSATARRNALQTTVDTALAEAAKLRSAEAQHRAGKYWDRANSAARGAEAAELRATLAQRDLAAIPARGKKAPPAATGSGPAGWSDAARAASIDSRQANAAGKPKTAAAKPAEKLPPIVGPETPHEKMAKAGTLPKGENAWIAKQVVDLARDGRGSIGRRVGMEAYKTLVRTTGSNEAARAEIRAVMGKKTPAGGMFASGMTTDAPAKAPASKPRSKASKAMGVLAPIGLGVAMLAASNQAKAAGADAKGQLKAAAKEGVATGAHMAGFMAGTTVATMGLMKAGLTAARAVPAVSAALMVGGAIHGAATAKPGERLAGAAKGAWDMSLPGMVVNTAVAAKGAVAGRLSSEQAMDFSNRNEAYAAERPAVEDGPGGGLRGFANPANQAAAQQARGVENITEWAQGATPKGKSKMGPR